jgi:hypothetical protein
MKHLQTKLDFLEVLKCLGNNKKGPRTTTPGGPKPSDATNLTKGGEATDRGQACPYSVSTSRVTDAVFLPNVTTKLGTKLGCS